MAPTHLPMRALDALLNAEHDGDPFVVIFESLQDVFGFDQALVLEDPDVLRCVAAHPSAAWPRASTALRSMVST
jgi:hypothetical protein